jgi:hypothetical protein
MNVTWDEAVSSPVLNVVHPRPIAWNTVMDLISNALIEEGVVNERLPPLPCSEWLHRLNDAAKVVKEEHLRAMVSSAPMSKLVPGSELFVAGSEALRLS